MSKLEWVGSATAYDHNDGSFYDPHATNENCVTIAVEPSYTEKQRLPKWLKDLLQPKGPDTAQVVARIGAQSYYIDLQTNSDGWRFLTIYEPITRQPLIRADFQIVEEDGQLTLVLPHNAKRPNGYGFDPHYQTYAFEWVGRVWGPGELRKLTHDAHLLHEAVLFLIGQIARHSNVVQLRREYPTSWYHINPNIVLRGLNSISTVSMADLVTTSKKKQKLAREQHVVTIFSTIDPDVAEPDTTGRVPPDQQDRLFARIAHHPPVLSIGEFQRVTAHIATHKAVSGATNSSLLQAAGDTDGLWLVDEHNQPIHDVPIESVTDRARGKRLAKDDANKYLAQFPGSTIVVTNGQALVRRTVDFSLPFAMMIGSGEYRLDLTPELIEAARKGLIHGLNTTQTIVVQLDTTTPLTILEQLVSKNSGLGIDFFPNGEPSELLRPYVRFYQQTSHGWKIIEYDNSLVREVFLGFSAELFTQMAREMEEYGFPFGIESQSGNPSAELTDLVEKQRKLGRLRAIYNFVSDFIHPNSTWVDMGVWVGMYLHLLASRSAHIIGFDSDHQACEIAKKYVDTFSFGAGHVEIIEGDVTATQLPNGSVQGVSLLEVAEYMHSPAEVEAAIQEASRITQEQEIYPGQCLFRPALIVSTRLKGTKPNMVLQEREGMFSKQELVGLLKKYYSEVACIYQHADGTITSERVDESEFVIALCYKERQQS